MNTLKPQNVFLQSLSGLFSTSARPLAILLTAATLLACGTSARAVTIFSDNFTGVAPSTGQESDGLNGIGWYFYNVADTATAYTIATDNTSPMSGNVLSNAGGTASNSRAVKQFSSVALANEGDTISLQFDFHVINNSTDTVFPFLNAGFYNVSSTITANAFGFDPLASADAYYINQHAKPTAVTGTFYEIVEGSSTSLGATSGTTTMGLSAIAHTASITLTRVATGMELTWTVDDSLVGSYIDTTVMNDTFNTVRFSTAGGNFPVNIDNVSVVSNVPEPSVAALLAGGSALLLCGFLRMRRR